MVCLSLFGVGNVGGGVAHLASSLGIVDRLIIHDSNEKLLRAQQLDLMHRGIDVEISTDKNNIKDSDICVFSGGLPRNPSVKTRTALLEINLPVASEFLQTINGFDGILITITNPMDINNYYLHKKTGLPRRQVIGFGGQLDSARFSYALLKHGVQEKGIVLGEHGEHQVPVFSSLDAQVSAEKRNKILNELIGASMEVIKGKGATVFGPSWHITEMIQNIVQDKRKIQPCSCILEGEYGLSKCSLGVPATLGKDGIHKIHEWELDKWETDRMENAADFVTELCRKLK